MPGSAIDRSALQVHTGKGLTQECVHHAYLGSAQKFIHENANKEKPLRSMLSGLCGCHRAILAYIKDSMFCMHMTKLLNDFA